MTLCTSRHVPFIVDNADHEALSHYTWGFDGKYISTHTRAGRIRLHTFLMGKPPTGCEWDHRDRNHLNNRRCNLRAVAHMVNARNLRLHIANKSGHRGVCWNAKRQRWFAYITVAYKMHALGRHRTLASAVTARAMAEKQLWGSLC